MPWCLLSANQYALRSRWQQAAGLYGVPGGPHANIANIVIFKIVNISRLIDRKRDLWITSSFRRSCVSLAPTLTVSAVSDAEARVIR